MPRFKDEIEQPKEKKIYTISELQEFQKELEPYLIRKNDEDYLKALEYLIMDIKNKSGKLAWGIQMASEIEKIRQKEISDEQIKQEAESLMERYFIGKLAKSGEGRFLIDKRAIRIDEKGSWIILKYENFIPFTELNEKLTAYKNWLYKIDYAEKKKLEEYDKMIESQILAEELNAVA